MIIISVLLLLELQWYIWCVYINFVCFFFFRLSSIYLFTFFSGRYNFIVFIVCVLLRLLFSVLAYALSITYYVRLLERRQYVIGLTICVCFYVDLWCTRLERGEKKIRWPRCLFYDLHLFIFRKNKLYEVFVYYFLFLIRFLAVSVFRLDYHWCINMQIQTVSLGITFLCL